MRDRSDAQLLREYAQRGNETAFREIVVRHTDLVYSAAMRQVGSPELARDVAQNVFTDLARKAQLLSRKLDENASLVGWLYRSTRFAALNQLREDRRRQNRERQAMEQFDPNPETAPDWDRVGPVLDEAMSDLSDEDREALLLRFFKNHDFRTVGQSLGVSDDAAQKRVARALEKLRVHLTGRGVTTTAVVLSGSLSANAVISAPAGLAASLSAAALAGTTLTTAITATATKAIAMTALQKVVIGTALVAAVGTGVYEARQSSHLHDQVQTLQQKQAPLTAQIAEMNRQHAAMTNEIASLRAENEQLRKQRADVPRLRNEVSQMRENAQEVQQLRASVERQQQQQEQFTGMFTNAMAVGLNTARSLKQKHALEQLQRMKQKLNLTPDQEQAIRDILLKHIDLNFQVTQELMTGKLTAAQAEQERMTAGDQEAEIKALLTPEQQAQYPEFKNDEAVASARSSTDSAIKRMKSDLGLTQEQQDQAYPILYESNLRQAMATPNDTANGAPSGLSLSNRIAQVIQRQEQQLNANTKALASVLSADQLDTYRQQHLNEIKRMSEAMKMFVPPASTAAQ